VSDILRDPRLVCLDFEGTGVSPSEDRIVSFCFLRVAGPLPAYVQMVNPGVPIPPASTAIHGISDADVADAPRFAHFARGIQSAVNQGVVLCGYSSRRYDTPLLDAELLRAGCPGLPRDDSGRINVAEIDLFQLWCWHRERERQMVLDIVGEWADDPDLEPLKFTAQEIEILLADRNLKNAARIFAGVDLEAAHTAEADAEVLPKVLEGMISAFDLEDASVERLCELSVPPDAVDRDGKFRRDEDGTVRFQFGKYRGEPVADHPDFLQWMLDPRRDFAPDTLSYAREYLEAAYAGAGA
jgi:DNA polymerase-3 subunit epsilon